MKRRSFEVAWGTDWGRRIQFGNGQFEGSGGVFRLGSLWMICPQW